ncbi:hypothetical protein TNCV_4210481 [Trichonephila clavipes]|nr:hypothetical protein TNCV_4210481 [Trichonephila clavipes]
MNAARCIEIFTRFMKRLRRVRPHYAQQGSLFFVHDNSRSHTAYIVKQFSAKNEVVQTEHPPFSPNLNPPDFFLFPRLMMMKLRTCELQKLSQYQDELKRSFLL